MVASPFCSFYSSYLQQKAPDTTVSNVVEQINVLCKLKRFGTVISYPRPTDRGKYELLILVFADAAKPGDHGQIGVPTGLLVSELKNNSIFHPISWISHKSKRPVKSVPAADILASAEEIDEAKAISHTYSELIRIDIDAQLCVDSKDLFYISSTQRNSTDRSIRDDFACIWFEFQVGNLKKTTWIPGNVNLADNLTKTDNPITEALVLTIFNGRLNIAFDEVAETKSSAKNYG